MQRLTHALALSVTAMALACGAPSGESAVASDASRYLEDASFRRASLVASLVDPTDGYAAARLAHYASGDAGDWDLLPAWNPAVRAIATSELARAGGPIADERALSVSDASADDEASLLALGRAAFFRYPVQLAPYLEVALASPSAAARYGLWTDATLGVGGLVRVRAVDGASILATTCATCHAAPRDGVIVVGAPNADLDTGSALLAASGESDAVIGAWGPGRLDVTTEAGTEPVAISDLRPVRWLTHLHRDGTIAMRSRTALAIRIETLIVTSSGQTRAPPRIVALALAAYVASLAESLPSVDDAATRAPRGAAIFGERCAGCHAPPAFTGPPVPLASIGTDPALGLSPERGTGAYRVPSLRGVGTRGPLLHDGTVPSLDTMFDPARLRPDFAARLHGAGAVPGHSFGLDLDPASRRSLVEYLRAL